MQVGTFCLPLLLFAINKAYFLINPRNIISNTIMLLNINATRGPTDCCSATHGLLLSEATGLWDAASRHGLSRPVERAPA